VACNARLSRFGTMFKFGSSPTPLNLPLSERQKVERILSKVRRVFDPEWTPDPPKKKKPPKRKPRRDNWGWSTKAAELCGIKPVSVHAQARDNLAPRSPVCFWLWYVGRKATEKAWRQGSRQRSIEYSRKLRGSTKGQKAKCACCQNEFIKNVSFQVVCAPCRSMGRMPGRYKGKALTPRGQGRDAVRLKKEIQYKTKGSEVRKQIAVLLKNLRHGKPLRTTMRENGWSDISQFVYYRKSYQKFKARRPVNHQWTYSNKVSKTHPFETVLQSEIREILFQGEVQFEAEAKIGKTGSRVDFQLKDGTAIECKVDTVSKHTQRLIGQLMTYKYHGAKSLLVVHPDDISIRRDLKEIIESIPAKVQTISEFKSIYEK
jgi:hypothetical protein